MPADGANSTQAPSVTSYSPQPSQTPGFEHGVSPDPSTALESSELVPLGIRAPVPVDFTTYQSNSNSHTSHLAPPHSPSTTYISAPSPRKRSLSATLDPDERPTSLAPHRPNAISSILNPAAAHEPSIDPTLSGLSPQHAGYAPAQQEDKSARKERLRREAETMRRELARRDKELQEMDDD